LTLYQLTGIPMLDIARIARYDMLVPVLGLGALHVFLSARKKNSRVWYFLCGALAGLAGLAHLYGLFWLPVLVFLTLFGGRSQIADGRGQTANRKSQIGNSKSSCAIRYRLSVIRDPLSAIRPRLSAICYLILGLVLPWLPYLAYVLGGIDDWRGQTRPYADRFDVLNPVWYLENVLQEYHRYGAGLELSVTGLITRIGFVAAGVGLPLVLGVLTWRAWHGDWRARVIIAPALWLPILFALFVRLKLVNYAVTIFPLMAIAAAWGAVTLWSLLEKRPSWSWLRLLLAVLLLAMVAEGATRVVALEAAARTTSPYEQLAHAIRRSIPTGARVLGYHTFWLGLADFDYRAFAVPLGWADAVNQPHPAALDHALKRVAPDIVLLDAQTRAYFDGEATHNHPNPALFYEWLARHAGQLVGRVDDPTYGLVEIYRVTR
jgi:hypothetical protein